MLGKAYLTAEEAARELDITMATLYTYVSRGLIQSETTAQGRRERRYRIEDITRLKHRQQIRRDPNKVTDGALHWGVPVLDSALTLINDGRCFYRGRDVAELAITRSVEEVASLIWLDDVHECLALFDGEPFTLSVPCATVMKMLPKLTHMESFTALLPLAATDDLAAYDMRPHQVAQTGSRILRSLALIAVHETETKPGETISQLLQRAWAPTRPEAAELFNTALILCADHELTVSSFTARCTASAVSSPYAVVSAGLAALQGVKHGGNCERVEALFNEAETPDRARDTIARRVRRGEAIPGFGLVLYPAGDPRGKLLLQRTSWICPQSAGVKLGKALADAGREAVHEEPHIDFALVTLCAALDLPAGAAIALYALGRSIGWIGHAIEEYQANRMIRPRANYSGRWPEPRIG